MSHALPKLRSPPLTLPQKITTRHRVALCVLVAITAIVIVQGVQFIYSNTKRVVYDTITHRLPLYAGGPRKSRTYTASGLSSAETASLMGKDVRWISSEVSNLKREYESRLGSCVDWSLAEAWIQSINEIAATEYDMRRVRNSTIAQALRVHLRMETWDVIVPFVRCPGLTRVGSLGDGGKWMCLSSDSNSYRTKQGKRKCVIYSFGVSTEVSFELALEKATDCDIFAFDPTPQLRPPFPSSSRVNFLPWGLHTSDDGMQLAGETVAAYALNSTMRRLNHSHVDVLKVDIESSEWRVFSSMSDATLDAFDHLMIELHFGDFQTGELLRFLGRLFKHGLAPVYKEVNNFYPKSAAELTMVSLRWLAANEPKCGAR